MIPMMFIISYQSIAIYSMVFFIVSFSYSVMAEKSPLTAASRNF